MGISERTLAALREERDNWKRQSDELYEINPISEVANRYAGMACGIEIAMRTIERVELVECLEAVQHVEERRAASQ